MNDDYDWMDDKDCLRAFAEKYEPMFVSFVEEYKEDLELAEGDFRNDLDRDDEI